MILWIIIECLFFPFLQPLFPGTVFGFCRCDTRLSYQLHTTAFLAEYSPQEEDFARNALQAVGSSGTAELRI